MVRRALFALVLALVAVPATSAHAAVTTKKAIWGPVEIDSQSQFPVYRELGAGIYQGRPDYSHLGGANSESTARRELELSA